MTLARPVGCTGGPISQRISLFSLTWVLFAGACRPCDLDAVDYTPLSGDDWLVSTPEDEGLDPDLVGQMYCEAERRGTLYGLLVIKNNQLVAEGYFNEGGVEQLSSRASVTKSYTSTLVGLALEEGCLSSVDQKMMEFFPELADDIEDPRKHEITIRQMLQMRAGYPWEETDDALWDGVLSADYVPLVRDFPLTADPGTVHQYSNLTSHWLGVIVARACDTDLPSFAEEHLFTPTDTELGAWVPDVDGYYMGAYGLEVTARDMGRFGQVFLDEGVHDGTQVIPASWVAESLDSYSDVDNTTTVGPDFEDYGYGYQWWSAQVGAHHVDFAWGHGGNFIFLVDALDLVVVVAADPFVDRHFEGAWPNEKAHLRMAGRFLSSLPE